MNHEIAKKITAVFDNRRLNRSGSSLFTAFASTVIALIVFTIILVSNLSVRDYSAKVVTIEIKTVVPYLPLSSEKELSADTNNNSSIKQQTTVKEINNLQVLEVFGGKDLSEKFQQRTTEFLRDDCEVKFMMTWISPAEMFGRREVLSVESVFKSHPRGCLMIISSTMDSPQGFRILKPFLERAYRVMAVTPDLPFLLKDTAGETWLEEIQTGKRNPGKIPLAQNLSNLMRLALRFLETKKALVLKVSRRFQRFTRFFLKREYQSFHKRVSVLLNSTTFKHEHLVLGPGFESNLNRLGELWEYRTWFPIFF